MPTVSSHPHKAPFDDFDHAVERRLGADMRLIYGLGVPILMICGLIVLLALTPTTWLVITILVLELAALVVVLTGLFGMLNEDDDSDDV